MFFSFIYLDNAQFICIFWLRVIHRWVYFVYHAVKIVNPNCRFFFRVLKFLSIHGIKQMSFLKTSTKLCECAGIFVAVLQISTLCFPSSFVASLLNSDSLSLVLRALAILYVEATSTAVNIYLYVLHSNILLST